MSVNSINSTNYEDSFQERSHYFLTHILPWIGCGLFICLICILCYHARNEALKYHHERLLIEQESDREYNL